MNSSNPPPEISVIIPVAIFEDNITNLLKDLSELPLNYNFILSLNDKFGGLNGLSDLVSDIFQHREFRIISEGNSRATCQNLAADISGSEYLWFLHSDSELLENSNDYLEKLIVKNPDSIYYFDLKFRRHNWLMKLNEIGANLRSKLFKLPFGDQSLCMKKTIFERLGKFDENVRYGEDNMLILKAKKENINIQSVNCPIYTSSRKYKEKGWIKNTLFNQKIWITQYFKYYVSK